MAGDDADDTGGDGGGARTSGGLLRQSQRVLRLLGIAALVAAIGAATALLLIGALQARSSYFEHRNLRELDRVADDINSTRASLASVAALHFVPSQLRFGLTPQAECLVATTRIESAAGTVIDIAYEFVDGEALVKIAERAAAARAASLEPGVAAGLQLTGGGFPPRHCTYARPVGTKLPPERVTIADGRYRLEETVLLSGLLRPILFQHPAADTVSESDCPAGLPPGEGSIAGVLRHCFRAAAIRDLGSRGSGADPGNPGAIVDSLEAAIGGNSIRIDVSIGAEALNLESALETFDAVMILGNRAAPPDAEAEAAAQPQVPLLQVGEIPPAIEADEQLDQTRALQQLFAAGTGVTPQAAGAEAENGEQRTSAPPAGSDNLLVESSVHRAGDLVVFQKKYASLGGLDCSRERPCRLLGIRSAQEFDRTVRQIEGLQATAFLIGVLTLVGLLPLIHLALRKRLDPIRWATQYLMWFSLSLLAASAMIASLTIWSAMASRAAGAAYAERQIEAIRDGFGAQLGNSLQLVNWIGHALPPSDQIFPAPRTWPDRDRPAAGPEWLRRFERVDESSRAPILETTSLYRRDGIVSRAYERLAMSRLPSYGASIADRPYFRRAIRDDVAVFPLRSPLAPCDLRFSIDRIFARPDGVARVVFAIPIQRACLPLALPGGSRTPALVPGEDPAIILSTLSLRTFLELRLDAGFSYAVIDPSRPVDEPDIIFHSRRPAELVERLDRDIDDQEGFRALVDKALTTGASPRRLSLDTRYRAEPARLTVARLNDNLDWVLVLIEHRNDAGFAPWRAATFGYFIWLMAVIAVLLVTVLGRLRNDKALDRRPGLWLWPPAVLTDFTPARFAIETRRLRELAHAAVPRDRHVRLVLAAGIVGVFAAEGASRIAFAFGATLAALAGRAHFRGRTATEYGAAQGLDRYAILSAAAFLALAVLLFWNSLLADYPAAERLRLSFVLRQLGFIAAILTLASLLLSAWRSTASLVIPPARKANTLRRRSNSGWMAVLMTMGAIPAAAGYLDSVDHDWYLAGERRQQVSAEASRDVERQMAALDRARVVPIARAPAAGPEPSLGEQAAKHLSVAEALTRYLDLQALALKYSDAPQFHMHEGFGVGAARIVHSFVIILLPIGILIGALFYFRNHYFRPPPKISWGRDMNFDPPLSPTRESFVRDMLGEAAAGRPPKPPFAPLPGTRHLILGVDLDVKDEPALDGVRDNILWIDLLKVAAGAPVPSTEAVPGEAAKNAIVIGNLDIALQLPDRANARAVFDAIEQILGVTPERRSEDRHVFLLADVEPLDRIALLRDRVDRENSLGQAEEWRWAALLQDFALYPIRPSRAPIYSASAIGRELSVINTSFARSLLSSLPADFRRPSLPPDYEDRAITYITEQMRDYYHKLWAASSDEERVMLYHIAWKRHLKMGESRALRSLLTRGLVVRAPEYRLLNRSFARYIRRVERPSLIRARAARTRGTDQVWPLIRYPLAILIAALLIVLQVVSPNNTTGAIGLLPAIGAIVPTLFTNWLRQRTSNM